VVAEATGTLSGQIVPEPRGQEGFGYDPVFLVGDTWKTLAELPTAEKNRISHRGQAMRALIEEMKAAGVLM
jgi:XTP/dITP diphosphohydrolase